MEQAKISLRKRLRRIGIFELAMFLLSCGVHYFLYKIRGKLPFTSELQVLLALSWPAMGIVMVYAARALKTNPEVTPRQILVATAIYGLLFANYAAGLIPMLLFSSIPFWAKASAPLPWLLLRGWFTWLLIGGSLRLVRTAKTEAQSAVAPIPFKD